MNTTLMVQLKAENVFGDSGLFLQIQELKKQLQYRSDNKVVSFDEYFLQLQAEAEEIPRVKLQNEVPSGAGMVYMSELLTHLEDIHDRSASLILKIVRFIGELSRANADVKDIAAIFKAWYIVGASEILSQSETKLPASIVKSLADSEFSRLMGNPGIESLLTALDILHETVKNKKKLAQTKFELGKEQANVSFYKNLPETLGINSTTPKFDFIAKSTPVEPDYDDLEIYEQQSEVPSLPEKATTVVVTTIQEPGKSPIVLDFTELTIPASVIPDVQDPVKVCELLNNLPTNETAKQLEAAQPASPSAKRLTFDDMEITPVAPILVEAPVSVAEPPVQEPVKPVTLPTSRRRTFTINMEGLE